MTLKLFSIGDDFYWKSGTRMSSIYEVGTFRRSDWGKVQMAARKGKVTIRPATAKEMLWAYRELDKIK